MTLTRLSMEPKQLLWCGGLHFLIAMLLLSGSPASASGPGPNGVNLGFDFNWNNGTAGATASFIAAPSGSGASLNNCGGAVNPSTSSCDFVFAYSIGGVSQPGASAGGVYQTWTLPAGSSARGCDENPTNSAPLTLFNCFNQNSFGQIFMAGASGALTSYSMNMTCLNPAGTPLTGVFAAIYLINSNGISIPGTPLATAPVNLSTCPTLTNWTGHTFTAADFAVIPINFPNVTLASGSFYGVYFGGLSPGVTLPGFPSVTSVAPNSGSRAGGNTVTLSGSGFTGATSVTFNGVSAPNFSVTNDTTISAVVPSSATVGAVSVIVTTPVGSNNTNTLYTYVNLPPTITSVSPNSGPPGGGNSVTITGSGFTGATSVTFGGTAASSFTVVNDTTITATVPAGQNGAVSVIVTTPSGSNSSNALYSYATPTPTLSQWGMIAMAFLLVLLAWLKLREDVRKVTS